MEEFPTANRANCQVKRKPKVFRPHGKIATKKLSKAL